MKEIETNELISAYYDNELTESELDNLLEMTKKNPLRQDKNHVVTTPFVMDTTHDHSSMITEH